MQSRKSILVIVATLIMLFAASVQASPTIDMIWRSSGTNTIVSPSASSAQIADIVLRTATQTVTGVFVSIEFDNTELTATSANELAEVSLPGMGNTFSPIAPKGAVIINESGLVINFEETTLATGLIGGNSRTLGSVTFHVVGAANDASDVDVIASLQNAGIDAITSGPTVLCASASPAGCNFVGASLTGPIPPPPPPVPEPTTALLLLAGVAGLGYVGRRSRL